MLRFLFRYNFLRLTLMCVIAFTSETVMAQSKGDKLFQQGLELQKKQTLSSQKAAISKFQSAKKLYDSAGKKKQCEDAIAVSNNIISVLNTPKNSSNNSANENVKKAEAKLEVSNEMLQLDYKQGHVTIYVTTTENDWHASSIANSEGQSFVTVTRNVDGKCIDIEYSENTRTYPRSQIVEVRAGDLKQTLTVEQSGKPCELNVEQTVVEFSAKGGKKFVEIHSNSDQVENDNNNCNWKVVSTPEWLTVIGEVVKDNNDSGKRGGRSATKRGRSLSSPVRTSTISTRMNIVVSSKPKGSGSRTGEIIISSANQQQTIVVHQN